ncbi:hypothetical protein [Streptomyces sp. NRRL B-24484]|uniref:hypothetical protein n=1 Tax=Streptomyces sp. NRRL B-24484 TaxID=1463833 RepID=UPI000694D20F|nr:hypothetical protein [Streptomyces sp. NRRL B-24484]
MTDQDNTPPAVWDPTARGGAGGWVRRRPTPEGAPPPPAGAPGRPAAAPSGFPPHAQPFPPQAGPHAGPQAPGASVPPPGFPPARGAAGDEQATTLLPPVPAGDQGPPPGARPYVAGAQPGAAPAGFPPQDRTQAFPAAAPPQQGFPPPQGFPPGPGFPPQGGAPFDGGGRPPFPAFDPAQAAPYPAAAPGPAYEDLDAEEPARNRTPLLIGAGVALLLLVGVGTVWAVQNSGSDGKPTANAPAASAVPPPGQGGAGGAAPSTPAGGSAAASPSDGASAGPGAEGQAKALDALLARGESAKAPIGSAVAKVTSCPDKAEISGAAQVFDDGASQRDQLVADLGKLDLGALPGGAEAAQTLKSAWQTSGDIDRAYAAWARTVAGQGCSGSSAPNTADKKRANDLNPQATQSKKDFVAKWNAIAKTYGLTERTWDRI